VGAALLAALACSGPTAGEQERAEEARLVELLRERIDPEGVLDLGIESLGGRRFVILLPPDARPADLLQGERTEALRTLGYASASPTLELKLGSREVREWTKLPELGYAFTRGERKSLEFDLGVHDARLDAPLELIRSCPEARIAFHVPFADGAYARTMTAPESSEHALEIRGDGSIWCGQMPLLLPGSGDWRLVDLHLEEFARCTGNMTRMQIAEDTVVVIEGFELRIEDGVDYGVLLHVLESCARDSVRVRSFRLVRVADGVNGAPLQVRLPASGSESAPVEALRVAMYAAVEPGLDRRVVTALSGAGVGAGYHTDSLEALVHELARLRADAVGSGAALIDAQLGVLYGDVAPVLEALSEAGYTDLRFAGRR
jgi:hypothetical protein